MPINEQKCLCSLYSMEMLLSKEKWNWEGVRHEAKVLLVNKDHWLSQGLKGKQMSKPIVFSVLQPNGEEKTSVDLRESIDTSKIL